MSQHESHAGSEVNPMAASATLHCLTGCATGEIVGLTVGTALGLSNVATVPLSFALAFVFGYTLSTLPVLKAGLSVGAAFKVVLAADTLSILSMEVVDNLVMALVPGALNAGLVNTIFWLSMVLSFVVAFAAAFPVNRWLLQRGKGHALMHEYHEADEPDHGWRARLPSPATSTLVAVLTAFVLGGMLVAATDDLTSGGSSSSSSAPAPRPR